MILKALQYLVELGTASEKTEKLDNGRLVYRGQIIEPDVPIHHSPPQPDPVSLVGLAAFVRFVNEFGYQTIPKGEDDKRMMVVVGARSVELVSPAYEGGKRFAVCRAVPEADEVRVAGTLRLEDAIIFLKTNFEESQELNRAISLCSRVKADSSVVIEDDGISQSVEVKDGLSGARTEVSNGVYELEPYRIFSEVTQPSSEVLIRLKNTDDQGIVAKFFTTDGDQWKVDGVDAIRDYLGERIEAKEVTIL